MFDAALFRRRGIVCDVYCSGLFVGVTALFLRSICDCDGVVDLSIEGKADGCSSPLNIEVVHEFRFLRRFTWVYYEVNV